MQPLIKITCPYCEGLGKMCLKYGTPYTKTFKEKRKAFQLRKKGKSLREVARIMNLKHPQSVKSLLDGYVREVALRTKK